MNFVRTVMVRYPIVTKDGEHKIMNRAFVRFNEAVAYFNDVKKRHPNKRVVLYVDGGCCYSTIPANTLNGDLYQSFVRVREDVAACRGMMNGR